MTHMPARILDFIAAKLNIRLQKNSGTLYLSLFFAVLMNTYANPCIVKEIVSRLPAQYLSVESLTICVSNLAIGMLWKGKTREIVIMNFMILAILETVASVLLGIWLLFVSYNVWVMAVASIVYTNCISLFISKCVMTFKSKLFVEKDREDFDNGHSNVMAIASIIGFITATCLMPSLELAIAFWSLACIFDDIGWICIYIRNRPRLISN